MKNTAHVIGKEMLNFLEPKGFPVEDYIGKCYNGTLNMMSEKKDVALFILAKILKQPLHIAVGKI